MDKQNKIDGGDAIMEVPISCIAIHDMGTTIISPPPSTLFWLSIF